MGEKNLESRDARQQSYVPDPQFPVPVPEPKELFGALMEINVPFKPYIDESVYRTLPFDMQFQLKEYPDEANLIALSVSRWDVRNNDLHRVGLHVPGSEERSVQYLRKELVDWQLQSEAVRNRARIEFPQISSLIGAIKRLERVGQPDEIFDRIYGEEGLYWKVQSYIEKYKLREKNEEEILQIAAEAEGKQIETIDQPVDETPTQDEVEVVQEVKQEKLPTLTKKERIEMLLDLARTKAGIKWADDYGIVHNFINIEVLLSQVKYYKQRFALANTLQGEERDSALRIVDNLLRNDLAELLSRIQEENLYRIIEEKAPLRDHPGYRRYEPSPRSRFVKTLYRIRPLKKQILTEPEQPAVIESVAEDETQQVEIIEEVPPVAGLEEVVEEEVAEEIKAPLSAEEEVAKELDLNEQQLQILKMFTVGAAFPVSVDRIMFEIYKDDVESWAIERYASGDDLQTVEKYWDRYRTVRKNLQNLIKKLEGKYQVVEVDSPDYNQHFWQHMEYEYINDDAMAENVFQLATKLYNESRIQFKAYMLSAYAEPSAESESTSILSEEVEENKVHIYETPMRQRIHFVESLINKFDELNTEEKQKLFMEVLEGIPDGRTELEKLNLTDPTGQLYKLKRNRIRVILYKYGSEYIVVDADRRDEDTFDSRKSTRRINFGEKIARMLFSEK